MNIKDQQINTLRELIMAKQAFDRSLSEFLNAVPGRKGDDRVTFMCQQLPDIDPRETDEQTLKEVLNLLGVYHA